MHRNILWAESRGSWVKGKQPKGCAFCGIVKGNVESKILYKDKDLVVIMNIFPYNTGHLQVLPTRHVVWPDELTDKEYKKMFDMIRKCIRLLDKVLKPKGYNVGANLGGEVAGGSIEHLHFQIVPRFPRDLGFMETVGRTKIMPEGLDTTYKNLMKHVKMLRG